MTTSADPCADAHPTVERFPARKRRGEAQAATRLTDLIERTARGCGPVGAGLIAWSLSTFTASPAFFGWTWQSIAENSRAADFLRLCVDPLTRELAEPIMAYRITVPLVAWLLHLPALPALLMPYIAHVGFLALSFAALRRRTDPPTALLGTIVVALSFALFWSNWRPGFTDTTSHLLAAGLLLTTSVGWVVPAVFLGLLNDERMILALPFIVIWHFPPAWSVIWIRQATGLMGGMAAAGCAYLLVRHGLTAGWIGPGIPAPAIYDSMAGQVSSFQPHLQSWSVWALNVFLSFRWAWVLVAALVWWLAKQGSWLTAAAFGGFMGLGVLASALVADVGRSVGFMFPAWLLAIAVLHAADPVKLQHALRWITGALLVTPVFFTFENFHVHWFRPLPLVLLRWITGVDPILHFFR